MTQENKDYSYLIGKKMKGFCFTGNPGYIEEMIPFTGVEGEIIMLGPLKPNVLVNFGTVRFWYPISGALENLVKEEQVKETEIPELGDGVLMEVSNVSSFYNSKIRRVFGKKDGYFLAFGEGDDHPVVYTWSYARPIQHKEISKEEAEQKLAELTKEKWKIV
jgi:hypothetical protein